MRKFEDATAKSEDEHAKLSCYANILFEFATSHFRIFKPKVVPVDTISILTSYSYSHAKNSATWWREAKNVWALFFFFSIYTNLLMFIFMDLLTHVYTYDKKK